MNLYFSDKTTCAFLCLKKQNECHAYQTNYKYGSNKENCMLYKFSSAEVTKCIGRYIIKLILQKNYKYLLNSISRWCMHSRNNNLKSSGEYISNEWTSCLSLGQGISINEIVSSFSDGKIWWLH